MATVPFAPSSEPGAGGAVPPGAEAERAGGGCAWGSVTGGRGGSGGRSAGGGWVWAVARPPRQPGMAEAAGDAGLGPAAAQECAELAAVIGATVPTGFEHTAAEEVQEKLGSASRISRDRGKIYFDVPARSLPEVRAGSPRRSLLRCTPCGRGGSVPFGSVWFRSVPFCSVGPSPSEQNASLSEAPVRTAIPHYGRPGCSSCIRRYRGFRGTLNDRWAR